MSVGGKRWTSPLDGQLDLGSEVYGEDGGEQARENRVGCLGKDPVDDGKKSVNSLVCRRCTWHTGLSRCRGCSRSSRE